MFERLLRPLAHLRRLKVSPVGIEGEVKGHGVGDLVRAPEHERILFWNRPDQVALILQVIIMYSYHLITEHLNTRQYGCPVFKW